MTKRRIRASARSRIGEQWSIEDEVYSSIELGLATTSASILVRVAAKGLHLDAHREHVRAVKARKLVGGRVPFLRRPEETAARLVGQALQNLRKAGDIEHIGRGWRIR